MESELILSVGGLPPLSARGCIQELMPSHIPPLRRTINGELICLGHQPFKYKSIIRCEDKNSIAIEGLLPGTTVNIACIQRLIQKINDDKTILLEREPVKGSVAAFKEDQAVIPILEIKGKKVKVAETNGFISYRPWLTTKVINFSLLTNEWGLKVGWKLEVEEV